LHHAPETAKELPRFLAQAYKYKEIGDYGVGLDAIITAEEAKATIDGPAQFVERVGALLTGSSD
jgi:hypothetical protein